MWNGKFPKLRIKLERLMVLLEKSLQFSQKDFKFQSLEARDNVSSNIFYCDIIFLWSDTKYKTFSFSLWLNRRKFHNFYWLGIVLSENDEVEINITKEEKLCELKRLVFESLLMGNDDKVQWRWWRTACWCGIWCSGERLSVVVLTLVDIMFIVI